MPRSAKKPARPKARNAKKPAIKLVPRRAVAKRPAHRPNGLRRLGFTAAPRSNKPAVARVALVPGTATREECLKRYLPLVRYVVERVASGLPHYVDHEDLHSAGVLGLLHAYDKFDAKKGNKFETYAVWRIKGAVLDQLRSLDWASRSTRRLGREAEACARRLDQKLGRTASDREIARAMKLPLIEYHRLMDRVRGSVLLSLDETRENEDGDALGLAEVLEDPRAQEALGRLEEEETKGLLRATLNRLPEQERLVIALYYYEQMTLREIGEALGISESRVSQVHTRAVERLRGRVERALAS
ncbi:MAG TPA: FliA/WhiG family RNA polymerase sigma factor [Candidatus Eisenbacteria bacterium]|nr:FliA/WhiG family RNA polymerase sigma factor [Candidatus Eisenbacteria bacterium]